MKRFPHINDDQTIIATGSHDKSLKFWSVPAEWLDFKQQAKAMLIKDKETPAPVSAVAKPEPVQVPAEVVEENPESPKPKKKKVVEAPKEEPIVEKQPEEAQQLQEEVHDLDKEESPEKSKKPSDKANLFDSDGEGDKEFK